MHTLSNPYTTSSTSPLSPHNTRDTHTLSNPQLSFSKAFGFKFSSSKPIRYPSCWNPCYINRVNLCRVRAVNHLELDALALNKQTKSINRIKDILGSMDDGRISVSPYDTAWIALIHDLHGNDTPMFPSSIDWISNNQLTDGSWGDESFFLAYDRLLNTLACVVALKCWNLHPQKTQKGIMFINDNINKLSEANPEHMICGFEFVFPALLDEAIKIGIHGIPYDAPVIQEILSVRDRKMERAPKELLHEKPTCLLHNLEGLGNVGSLGKLDWEKLLKLQTPKGSFLGSPAATAFAVMETKDKDCIAYIEYIVKKFNGGAPTIYPVDVFARLWAVDRLQRLGISRYFHTEINKCLDYIYRYWGDQGFYCTRESEFCDIDDTCMAFRLLRMHGYNVTTKALSNFQRGDEFTCYVGQIFESPSPIFNLYRASQVMFPGETILEQAREFSYRFLKHRMESDQLLDKWVISKHLPQEIKNGLEVPWYASLPRIEARLYMETYGVDDIWIGKTLYRMLEINELAYLELAKLDFSRCQTQHQREWARIQEWYKDSALEQVGVNKRDLLLSFFLAAASIFEPERSLERMAWAKMQIVSNALSNYYYSSKEKDNSSELSKIFFQTLHQVIEDTREQTGSDIGNLLHDAWAEWLARLPQEGEEIQQVELIVRTVNLTGGHMFHENVLYLNEYKALSHLTNKLCFNLRNQFENGAKQIEKDMQLLVQMVLEQSPLGISKSIKQTFLMVAKTFYYRAYFSNEQIEDHISKLLLEHVM